MNPRTSFKRHSKRKCQLSLKTACRDMGETRIKLIFAQNDPQSISDILIWDDARISPLFGRQSTKFRIFQPPCSSPEHYRDDRYQNGHVSMGINKEEWQDSNIYSAGNSHACSIARGEMSFQILMRSFAASQCLRLRSDSIM
jgi:hypothetical protein